MYILDVATLFDAVMNEVLCMFCSFLYEKKLSLFHWCCFCCVLIVCLLCCYYFVLVGVVFGLLVNHRNLIQHMTISI